MSDPLTKPPASEADVMQLAEELIRVLGEPPLPGVIDRPERSLIATRIAYVMGLQGGTILRLRAELAAVRTEPRRRRSPRMAKAA